MSRSRNANRKRHKLEDIVPADQVEVLMKQLRKDLPAETGQVRYNGLRVDEPVSIETIRTTPICWGIPFDEIVFSKWVRSLWTFNRILPWDDTNFAGSTYLPEARNVIHSGFVTELETPWLFMLDSDVSPPPRIVERLLEHTVHNSDIKMVGAPYRKKAEPYGPVVYRDLGDDEDGIIVAEQYEGPGDGLETVDLAGAGCWLMSREVAEAIGEKPYSMAQGGEDLLLCRKVREAGFDLFIDWSLMCAHVGVGVA